VEAAVISLVEIGVEAVRGGEQVGVLQVLEPLQLASQQRGGVAYPDDVDVGDKHAPSRAEQHRPDRHHFLRADP